MATADYKGVLKYVSEGARDLIVDQTKSSLTYGEEGIRLVKSANLSACYGDCDFSVWVACGCPIYYDYRTGFNYEPGSICILGFDS